MPFAYEAAADWWNSGEAPICGIVAMYLLVIYTLFAGSWAVAANFGAPHDIPVSFNGVYIGDKIVHFAVVGLFALVLQRALWRSGVQAERSLLWSALITASLCAVEELSNLLTPHRTFSFADYAADLAGIMVMLAYGWLIGIRSVSFGLSRRLSAGASLSPATKPVRIAAPL
jgi:hypothetical protein